MDPEAEVGRVFGAARRLAVIAVLVTTLFGVPSAGAWELAGRHTIRLHPRVGDPIVIGTVEVRPVADRYAFSVQFDHKNFKDFFLSMREFKCLEGDGEIQCHVPYPYRHPSTVTESDFTWLEHALLFLFKAPRDFGVKLWNGIYYKLQSGPAGLIGRPQAVDLNQISAPPIDPNIPPFSSTERTDISFGTRWFHLLTID